jgi:ADP-ribosyl-[dinitrogen reductase] hydrolase
MIDQPLSGVALRERYLGGMLGLAVGDALGAQPDEQLPGRWVGTELTAMALCLADSLAEQRMFHPRDQLIRYSQWKDRRAIGGDHADSERLSRTVEDALFRFERTGDMYCGSLKAKAEDAAAVARLVSVPLYYMDRPEEAIVRAGDSAMTTHGMIASIDACRYLASLLVGAANGVSKEVLLSGLIQPAEGFWERRRLVPEIEYIASGEHLKAADDSLHLKHAAPKALSIALRAFDQTCAFAEGALLAVREGQEHGIPCEVGAVYGQLAGVYYGIGEDSGIPAEWLERLADREIIEASADRLREASLLAAT